MNDGSGSKRSSSRRLAYLVFPAVGLFVAGFVAAVLVWQFSGGGVWRSEVNLVEAPRRMSMLIVAAAALLSTGSLAAVWQFSGGGVWRSDSSVAETPRRLPLLIFAAATFLLTGFLAAILVWQFFGGGIWRSEVGVHKAGLHSPTRLALLVKSCHGDPEVTMLRETDADVRVEVTASSTPFRGGDDCLDLVEVQLQEPLEDRLVIDKHTGRSVDMTTVN